MTENKRLIFYVRVAQLLMILLIAAFVYIDTRLGNDEKQLPQKLHHTN